LSKEDRKEDLGSAEGGKGGGKRGCSARLRMKREKEAGRGKKGGGGKQYKRKGERLTGKKKTLEQGRGRNRQKKSHRNSDVGGMGRRNMKRRKKKVSATGKKKQSRQHQLPM